MIELRVVGSGDAFGHGGRFQSCIWLRTGDFQLLVDCGATSLLALRRLGVDPSDIDAVLASHFHGDHFGGLPYLILDGQFAGRTRPLTVAGPPGIGERLRAEMEVAFAGSSHTRQRFAINAVELGISATAVGPLRVRAFPVVHTPGADAVGLRIDVLDPDAHRQRSLAYSGDTEWTPALLELADSADLFICEAYSFEKRIPYHLDYRTLVAHRSELTARRILLTHLGPEMLARAGEAELECATDGLAMRV